MFSVSSNARCALVSKQQTQSNRCRSVKTVGSLRRTSPVFSGSKNYYRLGSFRAGRLTVKATAPVEPTRTGKLTVEEKKLALSQAEQIKTALESEPRRYSDVQVSIGEQVGVTFQVTNQPQFGEGDVDRITKTIVDSLPQQMTSCGPDMCLARINLPLVNGESVHDFKAALEETVVRESVICLMEKGSDDRSIFLGEERLNKYFTGMRPLPDHLIHRGTCTSSSPTKEAFDAATEVANELWTRGPGGDAYILAQMRARIQKLFCQDIGTLTFHPSGTDAESVPLLYAVLRSRNLVKAANPDMNQVDVKGNVLSIVTCATEVGSGTEDAARGCYFSSETPLNVHGCGGKGQQLPDLHKLAHIEAVALEARGTDGLPVSNAYDERVYALAKNALDQSPTTVVVLHTVAGSKTGMFAPSWDISTRLVEEYGDRVVAVLDACQMRHAPTLLPRWLKEHGLAMITGSKFYGGPSFSGGVLLANKVVDYMQSALFIEGPTTQKIFARAMSAYLTRHDVCSRIPSLCGALPPVAYANLGLILRWAAALHEMESLDEAIESVGLEVAGDRMREWVMRVRAMVSSLNDEGLVQLPVDDYEGSDYQLGGINSIVPVRLVKDVTKSNNVTYLNVDELKIVYKAMYMNVSELLPAEASEEECRIAGHQCLLGQPVPVPQNPVLRTCMGAPQFKQLLSAENFEEELESMLELDWIVLRKLAVCRKYFSILEAALA